MATQQTQPPDPAGLYRKIAAIAGAIGRVEKDGYNPQLKYRYPTPATIMETVKPLLAENHIALVPQVSAVIKEPTGSKTQGGAEKVLTRVEMTFLLLDGESGATLAVPWVGEGEDWSDKGIAKAQTIALRTFLVQLFQIPSGDEADPDAGQAQPPQQRATSYERPAAKPQQPAQNDEQLAAIIARIEELVKEGTGLKIKLPAAPKALNQMSYAELIAHGKALGESVETAKAQDAEQRFYARYADVVGGQEWASVQKYLGTRTPRPHTFDQWVAAAHAVRDTITKSQAAPKEEAPA